MWLLKLLNLKYQNVDYGLRLRKNDVALAFMYRVEGIVALANRLAEECADG